MVGDYISREAAMPDGFCVGVSCQKCPFCDDPIKGGCKVARFIDAIPAADVAEVVRCCECIYHDDESQYHYCRKWRRNCPDDSEFYCKWGKRKDGGRDDA